MDAQNKQSCGNPGTSRASGMYDNGGRFPHKLNHEDSRNSGNDWTFTDIKHLFNQIKNSLPDKDVIQYWTAIDLIDWNKIKFKSFTGAECKTKMLELMESTRCYRTLTEIVNDAEKIFIFKDKSIATAPDEQYERNQYRPISRSRNSEASNMNSTPIPNQASQNEPHTITLRNRVILVDSKNTGNKTPLKNDAKRQESRNSFLNGETREARTPIQDGENSRDSMVDNKFNVSLQNILQHTNWSQVVVNCGEQVADAPEERQEPNKNKTAVIPKQRKKTFKRKYTRKAKNRIKRPVPPFVQYFIEERVKLKEKHPEMSPPQIASLAGKQYQNLSESSKEIFVKNYREQKAVYDERIKEAGLNVEVQHVEPENMETQESEVKMKVEPVDEGINGESASTSEEMMKIDLIEVELNENSLTEENINELLNDNQFDILQNIPIKVEANVEVDILENVQSSDIGKDHWGLMFYANENLCKLTHTKVEDKMDVISNLWRSLEDDEREVYMDTASKLSEEVRQKMQETVFSQVNINQT